MGSLLFSMVSTTKNSVALLLTSGPTPSCYSSLVIPSAESSCILVQADTVFILRESTTKTLHSILPGCLLWFFTVSRMTSFMIPEQTRQFLSIYKPEPAHYFRYLPTLLCLACPPLQVTWSLLGTDLGNIHFKSQTRKSCRYEATGPDTYDVRQGFWEPWWCSGVFPRRWFPTRAACSLSISVTNHPPQHTAVLFNTCAEHQFRALLNLDISSASTSIY